MITTEQTAYFYDITIDDLLYEVRVTPLLINDEQRFVVSVNNAADHIYAWDEKTSALTLVEEVISVLPESLVIALTEKLLLAHLLPVHK
ncbi:MAG: hypothetical protein QM802_20830 [Agriterribacter sp.]